MIRTARIPLKTTLSSFSSGSRHRQQYAIRGLSTAPSKITELTDLTQFKEFVSSDKLSVIDFYATWCGPCKALEPIFELLAQKVPEANFGRVDVDQAQDVAAEYGITAMPTSIYFKDGQKIDQVIGANPPKIVQLIEQHANVTISK